MRTLVVAYTLQPLGCSDYYVHIRFCISDIDDLTVVPYTGDDSMA